MRRSSRLSLGGSVLRDSTRHNTRSPIATRSRVSFGGCPKPQIEIGKESVDRRALLDKWRNENKSRENETGTPFNKENCSGENKRLRNEYETSPAKCTPPLPPPSSQDSQIEGTTALERFRLRRKQRQMQSDGGDENSNPETKVSAALSSICFDDDDEAVSSTKLPSRSGTTPMFNRRLTMSGGSTLSTGPLRRPVKGRKSLAPASFNEDDTTKNPIKDNGYYSESDTVDGPGVRSRITNMEKRIQQLEKEKMALAMSKAPLEARLRQKEDQWTKERMKFEQENMSYKAQSLEAEDKYKSLEMTLEDLQEENSRLRYEAMKQKTVSSQESEEGGGGLGILNRQLHHDRDIADLKDKLRNAEEEIKSQRLEKFSIQSEVTATNLELSALIREYDSLQSDYDELHSKKESNSEAEITLLELSKEHTATTALLNATSGELASLKSQSKFDLEVKEQRWQQEKDKLLFEMSVLKSRAATVHTDLNKTIDYDIEDEDVLKAKIEERDRRISELEKALLDGERVRRTMHNRIQELRGNIRVFVRTRPFLPGDGADSNSSIDVLPDGENLTIVGKNPGKGGKKIHNFKFDMVFPPSTGQNTVFDEVSDFVQSALDGYHVCLFSYGQTGSGKTHTMQGSGNGPMRGIIPRAVEQILSQAKAMQNQKWVFSMKTSFLEIYNEELKDLLLSMNEGVSKQATNKKLSIRRDKCGKSYVEGLTEIDISVEDEENGMECLKSVMAVASRARSVANTKMNSQSSRSHSVFMLHLNGRNEESGTSVEGALNLCDLAGSERLSRSGAGSNTRQLRETQAINKSLSCLGDVFTSLANGTKHVPFRNSKLTYLLQDCLSGDGKALMFVNLSPTEESSSESLCSLRFAQRVNQVELGKATKHIDYSSK